MPRLVKYVKFLLTSTNQHGVHSPFIYNYLTKCLYRKAKFKAKRTEKIAFKSIVYFDFRHIWAPPDRKCLRIRLKKEFPSIQFDNNPYDLAIMNVSDFSESFESLSNNIHNDTVFIIDHIHKTGHNDILWEQIKNKEQVTVTLDTFHCGVVFFRQEQAKEHFKIRI